MSCRTFCCAVAFSIALACSAFAKPTHLRCEYLQNPLGIDQMTPQLSWQSDDSERNWRQSAYEVLVATNPQLLRSGKTDTWDSGKVNSSESVGILYAGPKLQSRRRYYWKVRVWSAFGDEAESTESAFWEMGLLDPADWQAQWISWNSPDSASDRSSMRWIWVPGQNAHEVPPKLTANFRLRLSLREKPLDAAVFLAVRGSFVASVNGQEVLHKRGWNAIDRLDISDQLVSGENAIEINVTCTPPFGPQQDAKAFTAALAGLVKLKFSDGTVERYATPTRWEAKLASESAWSLAQVVGDLNDKRFGDPGPFPETAPYLRKTLDLPGTVQDARLYLTALGSYRFFLNGRPVSDDRFTPEFTDYRKRVLYQTYDVTPFLQKGQNVLGAILGDGWYGSPLTWVGERFFPPPDRLLAQLEIAYTDGRHETFITDGTWKGSASPVLKSEIYAGETYDARVEQRGWATSGFDDSRWTNATVGEVPEIKVTSDYTLPARVVKELVPVSLTRATNGSYVFDMGQNMVGWARLKVKGPAGSRVRLRFAEILNPDGTIYTTNLRNATATDLYILKGGEEESFAPQFTFHGFRYVEVTGFPGVPTTEALTGEVVSSLRGEPTGTLFTSSGLINRMWSIGLWGQRGNFLSIPTDCPQRDERLGWMGDAEVFWRTGSYNFDISSFSQKFIQDISDAQTPQGAYTNVSPDTLPSEGPDTPESSPWYDRIIGAPGWGDAGVIVPWTTWMQYGNSQVILHHWNSMQRWMKFIQDRNPDLLRRNGVGPNFGDWLAPDPHTDKTLLATAYWALMANMMSEMAHAVGKEADAKRYLDFEAQIRTAFQKAYIAPDGIVGTGTQTSYVIALYTNMAPKELEPKLVDHLVHDIEARDWHLSTGFLGTPFLLFSLADHGRTDVAYRLLLNDTYPSWGYMLSKGATTWWERWNGDTGDPAMNSYNHYAFGSVMAWAYRYVAGIDTTTAAPGFRKIVIRPHLDPRLTSSKAEYESIYGKISTEWSNRPEGPFELKVTIPANTSADVYLPARRGAQTFEGLHKIDPKPQDGAFLVQIGSGTYDFKVR